MDISLLVMIIGLALATTVICVFLKESRTPTLAVIVALVAGALIFIRVLPSFSELIDGFGVLTGESGIDPEYLLLIIKIIGIAYLAEFSAQLCRDAGQGALALKIEFVAKLMIMLMALPIVSSLTKTVVSIL